MNLLFYQKYFLLFFQVNVNLSDDQCLFGIPLIRFFSH